MNNKKLDIVQVVSMTSLEISEVVSLRHDNVKRTIETLIKQGVIARPQSDVEQYCDKMKRKRTLEVFRFSGEQGKRDCDKVLNHLKAHKRNHPLKGFFYIYDFGHILKIGISNRSPEDRRANHVHDLRKVGLPYKVEGERVFCTDKYKDIELAVKKHFCDSATTEYGEWLKGVRLDDVACFIESFVEYGE